MIFIDGGSEHFETMRKNDGQTATNGYRRVTTKLAENFTQTTYKKINEKDFSGLAAIVTDGKVGIMPEDPQEIKDLKFYLHEKYSCSQ